MNRHIGWLVSLLLMVGGCWHWEVGAQTPQASPDAVVTPPVNEEGAASRTVEARVIQQGGSAHFTVEGLAFGDVTAWTWQGRDITSALQAALADQTAALQETAAGFAVIWSEPPTALGLDATGRLDLEAAAKGLAVTAAAPIVCPATTAFGAATSPVLDANPQCLYGSATCLDTTKRHTGIDFPGAGNALAIALGTVVWVETLNAADQGLGANVIVRHVLPGPNCAVVYSSYSHLASIDPAVVVGAAVVKGQTLGVIGRSGFGNPNHWPVRHLHLEVKSAAVTGNPLGVGTQTRTCATGPLNAKANTCWGYVATAAAPVTAPDDYGYLNPAGYLNKTLKQPAYSQSL